MEQNIEIRGASENNLKRVNVSIPKGKLVVVAGVSGSGKSSLVFDTIAVESIRQLGEMLPPYVRSRMPHYEAPKADLIDHLSPAIIIDQRPFSGGVRSTVGTMTDIMPMLRLLFSRCARPSIGSSAAYSFHDPQGMCPACSGLGSIVQFDLNKLVDTSRSLQEGAILFPGHQVGSYQWQLYANAECLDADKKLCEYTEQEWQYFLHGSGETVQIRNTTGKVWNDYQLTYEGFLDRITRLYLKRSLNTKNKVNQRILRDFTVECPCPCCHGTRLNDKGLGSRLNGWNIAEVCDLELTDMLLWLERITDPVGISIAEKIADVIRGIEEMGLGYVTLNRSSKTLSGGESQRLRMIRHLGSSLTGITYIFDEPSTGLHPQDVARLIKMLVRLRDRGNTILVVEHDKQIISAADQVIEMGPLSGKNGGRIVFQGTPKQLAREETLTANALRSNMGRKYAPRKLREFITVSGAKKNNLKNITVHIPQRALTVVSGPAGSGKSSLICGELLQQFPDAVHISQKPVGAMSSSNPATYIGIMTQIRKLFAEENHVEAAWFSYNSKGACPVCKGRGEVKTEMAFMDPVTVRCEACHGSRYRRETLGYLYKGKNMIEVLSLTVEEAMTFFDSPQIRRKLQVLCDVGMGYMTLGQPTNTLSGGECQRVKIARYLNGKNGIYILDEPTNGLHRDDVMRLMALLNRMVANGNTIVVIEHNLDVIQQADWNIDLGPGGGKHGGEVLFEGTTEQLMQCKKSVTAAYLRREWTNQEM